jgi:hypothetical protein
MDYTAAADRVRQAKQQVANVAMSAGMSPDAAVSYTQLAELQHLNQQLEQVKGAVQQLQHSSSSSSAQQITAAVQSLESTTISSAKEVKAAVQRLEATLKRQARMKDLRWALTHVEKVPDGCMYGPSPRNFIHSLLLAAIKGQGCPFPGSTIEGLMKYGGCSREAAASQVAAQEVNASKFRTLIADRVHSLTGIEPRLVDQGDRGWFIYID